MKRILKLLCLWFIMGMVYFTLEGLWRIPQGGYANIVMLPIGGLCCVLVGAINQMPKFYGLKMLWQSLIGMVIVLVVEFCAGMVLNVWLDLGIWDYSGLPLNIKGQVCLGFAGLWFLIMPLAIWLEDCLRFTFWHEGKYYSLGSIYKDLICYR